MKKAMGKLDFDGNILKPPDIFNDHFSYLTPFTSETITCIFFYCILFFEKIIDLSCYFIIAICLL